MHPIADGAPNLGKVGAVALPIRIDALRVWRDEAGQRPVIGRLSLEIAAGERVVLAGPNGAGKTSLLLSLVGAVPSSGRIEIGGRLLERSSLAELRRQVGYVFAEPHDQLLCGSVREEVALGLELRGVTKSEIAVRAARALEAVGLAGFEERSPAALSLGEQRRVVLASVLCSEPGVVLIDEPTASLDPVARRGMLKTLSRLDSTLIVATHDLDAALELEARVVLMKAGELIADGTAARLLTDETLLDQAGLALPISVAARRSGA
jgi:cobalt/nickel transport system ATP-binding protein